MTTAIYPSLEGRTIVVTGGGSGIGAAITTGFVRQGALVHCLDIAEAESRALTETLGERAVFHFCDLTDAAAITKVFERIGGVDVLINNAANDDRHSLDAVTPDYFDNRIAVNLKHHFLCAQAVAPGMRARKRGAIVNMGSISWRIALADLLIYETAKAGIEGLTRGLARELGGDGIRVNCVVPGAVQTARQIKLWHKPEDDEALFASQCLKSWVQPEDVAAMVIFLASEDARMCTAQSYLVDAGWS